MISDEITVRYIGGPTCLLQMAGLRFLTDPTFDPAGTSYPTSLYTLNKTQSPLMSADDMANIDIVLLSHDHHYDNLDNAGRAVLQTAGKVYTTPEGATRLGNNAAGLHTWETVEVPLSDNRMLCITGTPCRHGPPKGDRGPVTGFVVNYKNEPEDGIYITGDTVWYEGIIQVAEKFDIGLVLLFMGAAVVKEVGADRLTMSAKDGVKIAALFPKAKITPLHYEGWQHYTESKQQIEAIFSEAGIRDRFQWAHPF